MMSAYLRNAEVVATPCDLESQHVLIEPARIESTSILPGWTTNEKEKKKIRRRKKIRLPFMKLILFLSECVRCEIRMKIWSNDNIIAIHILLFSVYAFKLLC